MRELRQFGLAVTGHSVDQKLLLWKVEAGAAALAILLDEELRTWQVDGAVDGSPVVPGDLVFGLDVSLNVNKILLCVTTGSAGEGLEVRSCSGSQHQRALDCLDCPSAVFEVDVGVEFLP